MNPAQVNGGILFDPIVPGLVVGLVGGALAGVTAWLYWRLGEHITRARNLALLFFRLLGLALLLAILLQPSRQVLIPPPTTERVTLVALDTSRSMKQQDAGGLVRLDAARNLLVEAGALARNGLPADGRTRLLEFSAASAPVTGSALDLTAKGPTTRFHVTVATALGSLGRGQAASALILLTDGHDFELINPARTAALARNVRTPIYAVAFGKQGRVRDVSVRITAYQPYCYLKQKARVAASLRLIGCEFEDVSVQLLRGGVVAQTRRLNADEAQELPVEFEVMEPAVGQYEYEVRAVPLEGELDAANNSAITYLNVIDQQIRALLLEGDPYWDTTFLQRSLMRNDKFDLDALIKYGRNRVRPIRKRADAGPLELRGTIEDYARYDVVILGRGLEQMLQREQVDFLTQYVRDRGGTVIFSRGPAFGGDLARNELEPVIWKEATREKLRVQASREGQASSVFRALGANSGEEESLPEILTAREVGDRKPLTATLAVAVEAAGGAALPVMVHRRLGSGQVVSLGVDGVWRWGLNAKVEGPNTAFDRFWDQTVLWLLAGRDFIPTRQFSFRPHSANILLGEKVHFRLTMRVPDPRVKSVPLKIFLENKEIARAELARGASDTARLTAEYLPERIGRYRVTAQFPDGTAQESRFIVFTENLEETEVATDVGYLKRLCESSGGRLLAPDELGRLMQELRHEQIDLTPRMKLTSLWDRATFFYLIGLVFGADWYLRRRWGLS